ncbi:hypothetical protein JYU34_014839 [Plutella xylostella]|uniref:Uncharacterized protein n=1 Tax=Plutella xylostella TaxID=51655 RepID=A0ABQ7Q9I6_PLUXY|nr:hypothetical protein JYU34_014839 [Plutella xylostella]
MIIAFTVHFGGSICLQGCYYRVEVLDRSASPRVTRGGGVSPPSDSRWRSESPE